MLLAASAVAQPKSAKRHPSDAEKIGISGSRSIRKELDDPESFRVSTVRVIKQSPAARAELGADYSVCVQGRAKNKMGGYVSLLGSALALMPHSDDQMFFASVSEDGVGGYNLYCLDDDLGIDVTDAVKAALKADRDKE
ncbi:MAG: hypothetical protein WBS24_18780 [Terriglobales bacterium]